jgi:hypothetical protein
MNRRTFFRNLVVGAAALPAVAKVVSEPSLFTYHKVNEWRPLSPSEYARIISCQTDAMRMNIYRHVAQHNPYSSLVQ